jgi:hypothetical protein
VHEAAGDRLAVDSGNASTGAYDRFYQDGIYRCICCSTAVFSWLLNGSWRRRPPMAGTGMWDVLICQAAQRGYRQLT